MIFKPVADPAIVIPLDKPIELLGTAIKEIALREPNGGDIFRVGNPVISFDFETGAYVFDERKAFAMLSRLSGLPIDDTLEKLQADDAVACFEALGPFFVKRLRQVIAAFKARKEAEAVEAASRLSSTKPDEQPAS